MHKSTPKNGLLWNKKGVNNIEAFPLIQSVKILIKPQLIKLILLYIFNLVMYKEPLLLLHFNMTEVPNILACSFIQKAETVRLCYTQVEFLYAF